MKNVVLALALVCLTVPAFAGKQLKPILSSSSLDFLGGGMYQVILMDDGVFYTRSSDLFSKQQGKLKKIARLDIPVQTIVDAINKLPANAKLEEVKDDTMCESDGMYSVSAHSEKFPGGSLIIEEAVGCSVENAGLADKRVKALAASLADIVDKAARLAK